MTKGIAFIGVWGVILAGLTFASERMAPVHELMKIRRASLEQRANEVRALSLGNSHAAGLDFSQLGLPGFHFWRTGGDMHEAAFLAEELLPALPNVQCIFVSLSPYSLHGDNGAPTRRSHAARRREVYARTASARHIEGDRTSFVLGKLSPLVRDDHWRQVLIAIKGQKRPARILDDGAPIGSTSTGTMSVDSLTAHGVRTAARHEVWIADVLSARPAAAFGGMRALDKLIHAATGSGLHVVLYTPPYHHSYLNAIPRQRLEETRTAGNALAARYDRVAYVDFSDSPHFAATPTLFRDSGHLNAPGAADFSRRLALALRAGPAAECAGP